MTLPDVRDMEISPPRLLTTKDIGYICATIICLAMLASDGITALIAAGSIASGMIGIEIGKKW